MKSKNIFFIIGIFCIFFSLLLLSRNIYEDYKVEKNTRLITDELIKETAKAGNVEHFKNSKREMPIKQIGGNDYIGYLNIKSINLNLPIISSWSYQKIRIAPARYQGSVYENNMIILAHNYKSHFGRLHNLGVGSVIKFTDIDNNKFVYRVSEITEVNERDINKLLAGDWDLTLFTCTLTGDYRVVVRCKLVNQDILSLY